MKKKHHSHKEKIAKNDDNCMSILRATVNDSQGESAQVWYVACRPSRWFKCPRISLFELHGSVTRPGYGLLTCSSLFRWLMTTWSSCSKSQSFMTDNHTSGLTSYQYLYFIPVPPSVSMNCPSVVSDATVLKSHIDLYFPSHLLINCWYNLDCVRLAIITF